MLLFAAGFVLGNVALHLFTGLPGWESIALAPLVALLFLRPAPLKLVGAGVAGFLWTLAFAAQHQAETLAAELEGRDVEAVIRIASIPVDKGYMLRFDAEVHDAKGQALPRRLRLSFYPPGDGPRRVLRPGDLFDAVLRLKRPNGYMNPGGFDYERYLFSRRIGATGYVRGLDLIAAASRWSPPVLRHRLYESLASRATPNIGAVIALALGERGLMEPLHRELLFTTGIGHLFAISGLHIALVFGFILLIFKVLLKRFLAGRVLLPVTIAATAPAWLAACGYAWLAGFTIPTQRALVMLSCVVAGIWLRRRFSLATTLPLTAVAVLVYDPLGSLTASLWLSFLAVAFIAFYLGLDPWPKPRAALRLQAGLPLALTPVSLWFFGYAPLAGALANFAAVPLVSLLILPCVLLAVLCAPVAADVCTLLVQCADFLLGLMWRGAAWLARIDFLQWFHRPPAWSYPFALGGVVAVTLLGAWRCKAVAALLLLPLAVSGGRALPANAFEATFLDVGQGLSVVVATRRHVLLFDTGPTYRSGFSTAEAVVVPYLRWRNVERLDMLMVSHGDNDHAGGVEAVTRHFKAGRYLGGGATVLGPDFAPCRRGDSWTWDGVRFEILHPDGGDAFAGNNGSCVLKVSVGEHALLLSADIEKAAEALLLERERDRLAASVMLVPHHGSLTSSTAGFISAVAPAVAVVTSGYRNRFGFPKRAVVQRYLDACAQVFDTARTGALTLRFEPGREAGTHLYRRDERRYWHRRAEPYSVAEECGGGG